MEFLRHPLYSILAVILIGALSAPARAAGSWRGPRPTRALHRRISRRHRRGLPRLSLRDAVEPRDRRDPDAVRGRACGFAAGELCAARTARANDGLARARFPADREIGMRKLLPLAALAISLCLSSRPRLRSGASTASTATTPAASFRGRRRCAPTAIARPRSTTAAAIARSRASPAWSRATATMSASRANSRAATIR